MGEVVDLFKNKESPSKQETKLTPELIREYKETILLVSQYQDSLTIEDWKNCYLMMLSFNDLMMKYIYEELNQ